MKSILYVGATLMIGASIYGFADYNKTRNKKEFKDMYAEKELIQPVAEKQQPVAGLEKTELRADVKKTTEIKSAETNVGKKDKPVSRAKKQKKKTLSIELFSRGALDEKYIKEEIKPELPKPKTDPVKGENKEQ